ncbi:MAG: hypothetical protein ABL984_00900 [Pyrinomonadaceae bacterium]
MTADNYNSFLRVDGTATTGKFSYSAVPTTGDSKSIAVVVPRGEVVRNFVHTGALDLVAIKAAVSLISVPFDEEINRDLSCRFGEIHALVEHPEPWLVRFEREILEMAHNRWIWSPAAQSRVRRHDVSASGIRQKLVRITKKVISRSVANRAGLSVLSSIERFSSRALNRTDDYRALFRKTRPSLVFNGSHVHSRVATQAVQAAQWLGIPTATFIFSWDNLTSQGRILLPYDHFLVWNEQLKRQLLEMYHLIRPEQVIVTGTPQFDFHFRPEFHQSREEFCRSAGADPEVPIVFYSTGMANHMPDEPRLVEQIADMLKDLSGAPQLLVRVYPKDLTGRFDELKSSRSDILFQKTEWDPSWLTPRFNDSFALVNALRHCALGINVASTVSLELCMFDKPVINIGYNPPDIDNDEVRFAEYYDFDHYRPLVESKAVDVAWTSEQLRELIHQSLHDPGRRKRERSTLIERMFGQTLDGRSADRVANALLNIAGGQIEPE